MKQKKLEILQNIQLMKLRPNYGTVRVIFINNDESKIIIDPEIFKKINNLESQEQIMIKDDKGRNWEVSFDGESLGFFDAKNKRLFSTTKEKLN